MYEYKCLVSLLLELFCILIIKILDFFLKLLLNLVDVIRLNSFIDIE